MDAPRIDFGIYKSCRGSLQIGFGCEQRCFLKEMFLSIQFKILKG
jgi:hypothetical protein